MKSIAERMKAELHFASDELSEKRLRRKLAGSIFFIRRRKSFVTGIIIVSLFYLAALFADFLAPYDYRQQSRREPLAPSSAIRFLDAEGQWHARPFSYSRRLADPLARTYVEETSRSFPLALFTRGYSYKLFGLIETDRHLFGLVDENNQNAPRFNLLGTDELGRDRFSRLLIASRFTLLVGPAGTLLASALGIIIGCTAGYSRRMIDSILMRAADAMMAMPTLVLILAARASFPLVLTPTRAAVLLISIFVAFGWAEMARLARGLVLSLKRREFVIAAESIGLTRRRILFRHILPNAARPLVVQFTLMLPAFLLAETALSFLGVGLQEPEPSWGNMLTAAADITLLQNHVLTLLSPAAAITLFVLGARLISEGMKSKD